MSGICGIIRRDRAPADAGRLARMMQAMAYRGPDGQTSLDTQGVALGHSLLDGGNGGPATGRLLQDENVFASADCRLDNRDELLNALGLAEEAGDTEILIAGYRRWREALAEHLLGDFAFIIWNGETRQLYAARDHFGVKPFYYACSAKFFVCCSDLSGLFASGLIERDLRESAVADFLLGLPPAQDATSYAQINRLPPAHYCVLSGNDFQISEYWTLPLPEIVPRKAAPQAFRALLTQAVAARLRGGAVGTMLSGGLDSSAIACLAQALPRGRNQAKLPAFSMVFDATPEVNERPYIEAVLAQGGFTSNFIASDDVPPFAALETMLAEQQDLFMAPNLACSRRLYHAAHAAGVRILLDGHGGDEVVPAGTGRLYELAIQKKWRTLRRQLGVGMLPPGQSRYAAYWVFLKNFTELRRLRGLPLARRMFAPPAPEPALGFLNPEFAARTQVAERQRLHHGRKPQSRRIEGWLHYHVLTGPMQSYAFEILDRTAAAAGVEARYPFWDKRLVEFCLSLDPTEKLDGGWSRLILRRGLEGVLPRKVQWRVGKFDFLSHLTAMMIRHHAGLIADILADKTGLLANYVDLAKLRIAFHALRANPEQANGYLVQFMSRLVVLAFWLRQQQEIRA